MFDNDDFNGQDDFFNGADSDFSQQDFDNSSADFFNNEGDSEEFHVDGVPELEQPSQGFNFGYKTVGVVVAVGLILIAFVILFLSKLDLVKKPVDTPQPVQVQQEQQQLQQQQDVQQEQQEIQQQEIQQETQVQQQETQVEEQQPQVDNTQNDYQEYSESSSDNGFVSIPDSTSLDYSSNVTQAQGVVSSLSRYLQDGQVIYCVNLDISIGTSTTPVHYYCGYNVYKQISVGEILNVEYQQVSDNCFSVCTISK